MLDPKPYFPGLTNEELADLYVAIADALARYGGERYKPLEHLALHELSLRVKHPFDFIAARVALTARRAAETVAAT